MTTLPVTLEAVTDLPRWNALEADWCALHEVSPTRSVTLWYEWSRTWWDVYGEAYGSSPQILVVRQGSELLALLPLYRVRQQRLTDLPRLRLMSTGEHESEETCADKLDLLHRPGAADAAVGAIARWLAETGEHCLDLTGLRADSPLLALPTQLRGWWSDCEDLGPCHVSRIEGSFEEWLSGLSKTARRHARQSLARAERSSERYEVAGTRDEALLYLEELTDLHQARWEARGRAGAFAAPRFGEFHRRLVSALGPDRAVLSRLVEGDRVISVKYGFRLGALMDCYQTGNCVDRSADARSPGVLGDLLMYQHFRQQGVTAFDQLLGLTRFKRQFGRPETELKRLHLWRPGVRAALEVVRLRRRAWRRARQAAAAGEGPA